MVANIDAIKIVYKDQDVGALSFDINNGVGTFMYASDFVDTGIELAPLMMPLRKDYAYTFYGLNPDTFKGLPYQSRSSCII